MLVPDDEWQPLDLAQEWIDRFQQVQFGLEAARAAEQAWQTMQEIVETGPEIQKKLDELIAADAGRLRGLMHRARTSLRQFGDMKAIAERQAPTAERLVYEGQLATLEGRRLELISMSSDDFATTDPFVISSRLKAATAIRQAREAEHDQLCFEILIEGREAEMHPFFQHAGNRFLPYDPNLSKFTTPLAQPPRPQGTSFPEVDISRPQWEEYWKAWCVSAQALVELSGLSGVAPLRYRIEMRDREVRWGDGWSQVHRVKPYEVAVPRSFEVSAESVEDVDVNTLWTLAGDIGLCNRTGAKLRAPEADSHIPAITVFEPEVITRLLDAEARPMGAHLPEPASELEAALTEFDAMAAAKERHAAQAERWEGFANDLTVVDPLHKELAALPDGSERVVMRSPTGALYTFAGPAVALMRKVRRAEARAAEVERILASEHVQGLGDVQARAATARTKAQVFEQGYLTAYERLYTLIKSPENAFLRNAVKTGLADDYRAALPLVRLRNTTGSTSPHYLIDTMPDDSSKSQFIAAISDAVQRSGLDVDFADIVAPSLSEQLGMTGELAVLQVAARTGGRPLV